MHDGSLEHLPDDALLEAVRRLTAHSNVALAELLAHLGEVELRGIHRTRACASLYTYCIYELRMSEDAAFRRAKAARLVRRYPEVQGAIASGEIHLTGLLLLAPFLGGEHHAEVLRRARFRSKRELLRLVAELDPKPAVPALIEPLGPSLAFATATVTGSSCAAPSDRRCAPSCAPSRRPSGPTPTAAPASSSTWTPSACSERSRAVAAGPPLRLQGRFCGALSAGSRMDAAGGLVVPRDVRFPLALIL